MSLNIKEIAETFEFNKDDLKGNRMLTNEIIVDDIMLGLGYNKRRDKSVQRLYNKSLDWIVSTNSGKKLAIKVLAYDETVDTAEDMQDTMKYCEEVRYSVLLVITGILITILRYDKENLTYNKVRDISLLDDLSDEDNKLIDAVSKDSFNLDFIDSCLKESFSYNDLVKLLDANREYISESLTELVKREVGDTDNQAELIDKFIEEIFNPDKASESHVSDEEIQALETSIQKYKEQHAKDMDIIRQREEQHAKDMETITDLKSELAESGETDTDNSLEIEQLNSRISELESTTEDLQTQLSEKNQEVESLRDKVQAGDTEIASLREQIEEANKKQTNTSGNLLSDIPEDIQNKLDTYVDKIREQSIKISEAEEARDQALEKVAEMQKEIDELSGSDLRFAERLLESIEDDKEDERSYVAVINKELLNYEDIHTFIGRCLQKLYEIKSFDASQFIFNGDIFKMDINSRFNDIVMNNKTYDVVISSDNENDELNKLRIVFSHFDDVVFVCKKIGTLTRPINFRYDIPEEHDEIQLESDEYLTDTYSEDDQEQFEGQEQFGDQGQFEEEPNFQGGIAFDDNQFDDDGIEVPQSDDTEEYSDEQGEGTIPYFDDGLDTEQTDVMEKHLLVGQLLNIDMLIWSEEPIKFNNIKYISTNIITFGISTPGDSYDKLLCKCIDAVLAIEAFNGSKDLVNTLKQKDFSTVNNFLKLYSPEYAQYPRINGTKYVVAGIESVQQVAAALLDICSVMNIDTQEIFLYFDAETSSQFIIENYDFDENAIRIAETTSYVPEEGVQPNQTIAIIKGDMFNHIVITKNSLKVHKEIFNKALAVKTKYLGVVLDTDNKPYEVMADMLTAASNSGIQIDYKAIGNVIGESYLLISNNEQRVSANHKVFNLLGETIYISEIEAWQVAHSLIKVHTALFNNTAIAVKSNVNADAITFYGNQFETSEPSLGLAVNSFVDYVASCVKD